MRRFRLYHPSLNYLMELSKGNEKSLGARSKEFSEILEDLLINGIWKRTGPGRLAVLDEWVETVLPYHLPKSFKILDIGASDGSTTFDTVCYYKDNHGIEVKATILERQLRLHCFRRGWIRYYLTHNQCPLLLQIGPLGVLLEEIEAKEGFVFNPIIRVMKRYLKRFPLEKHMSDYGDLLLENPVVKNSPDIIWLERDLFQFDSTLVETFDFIRCCNVLNCGYFNEAEIYDAIRLLARYLKPKGLLLVSRTIDDPAGSFHNASLWMKNGEKLQHLSDLNGGSEVKKLVPVTEGLHN